MDTKKKQQQQQQQQAFHRKRSRRVSVDLSSGKDEEINRDKKKKARLSLMDQQATRQVDKLIMDNVAVVYEAATNDVDDHSPFTKLEAESTSRVPPSSRQEATSKSHVITPRTSMSSLLGAAGSDQSTISSSNSTSSNSSGSVSSQEDNALDRFCEPLKEPMKRDNEQQTNISSTAKDELRAFTEGRYSKSITEILLGLLMKVTSRYRRLSSGSKLVVCVFTVALAIRSVLWLFITHPVAHLETGDQSVYVTGGGFSGFWFTLGRLRGIPDFLEKDFYCFSAGCLAVVATLGNFSMDEMYKYASDAQVRWQQGTLHRHDVVSAFLGDLLSSSSTSTAHSTTLGNKTEAIDMSGAKTSSLDDPYLLSKLNVITSIRNGRFGLTADIRKPNSILELRTMLLQTTWIPFIVGNDLWHSEHMDGAFSAFYHPKCAHTVGLVASFDLLSNIVNVNLGKDKVEALWEMGLNYGL